MNKISIYLSVSYLLISIYGCIGTTLLEYKSTNSENDFVYVNGVKDYIGGINLYVDFMNTDSLYKIKVMELKIQYDSVLLAPSEFRPPFYMIKSLTFDSLPDSAKFTSINYSKQFVVFFKMKKEEQPDYIYVIMNLEGTTRDGLYKSYTIMKKLKFRKRKQLWYI
jgi:hypothetical protein